MNLVISCGQILTVWDLKWTILCQSGGKLDGTKESNWTPYSERLKKLKVNGVERFKARKSKSGRPKAIKLNGHAYKWMVLKTYSGRFATVQDPEI